jgi:predicted RNA binding protein YcfA (HicA-like mRNA interferase family)
LKVRELIRLIEADGWFLVRQSGSHKQFKHPNKRGLVTISDHSGDVSKKDLHSVLKQADLKLTPD